MIVISSSSNITLIIKSREGAGSSRCSRVDDAKSEQAWTQRFRNRAEEWRRNAVTRVHTLAPNATATDKSSA